MSISSTNLYLILGEEEYLKSRAIQGLKKRFLRDSKDNIIDCHIFDAEEDSLDVIMETASTFSFLADKRVIVIYNVDRFKSSQKKVLLNYLLLKHSSNVFILEAKCKELPKDNFFLMLGKRSKTSIYNKLYDEQLNNWIAKEFASRGKVVQPGAIELLVQLKGNNLRTLTGEIDKLCSYVGFARRILIEDITSIVSRDIFLGVFEFLDTLASRNIFKAINIGLDIELKELSETIGLFCWQLRRVIRAKYLLNKGYTADAIVSELGIRRFFLRRFLAQVRTLDIEWLRLCLDHMQRLDILAKSSGKRDIKSVWDMTIVKLSSLV